MFSELNNLVNITNQNEYAAICGITLPELKDNFGYGIRQLSLGCECTPDEILERLREQYDGQWKFNVEDIDGTEPMALNRFSTPLDFRPLLAR